MGADTCTCKRTHMVKAVTAVDKRNVVLRMKSR